MEATMSAPTTFGERLKARRNELGLTLSQLSDRVGIHLQSLAKIESGDRPNPTWDTVTSICTALDVTPDYFFEPLPVFPPDDAPRGGKRK
ncbi:MAG: helix-turn-helix domain-containing protein [Fimbriiglobus sp.]